MHYVVIGGSIAGISAAKAIRRSDARADITMLSAEKAQPYYRPLISTVIERRDIDLAVGDKPAAKYGIRVVYEQAAGIDIRAKEIRLASNRRMSYDKALIATGRRPMTPDVPGIAGLDVFPFWSMEDAHNILAAAQGRKHAVVLGGGFAGLKAAIALKRLGLAVTIIERRSRILHDKLDEQGSAIVSGILRQADIDLVTNQQFYEIMRASNTIQSVRLASGRIISANLVVAAIGTAPNVEPFRNSGITIHKGIVVQETLQTNVPDVYAAGDVVEYRDLITNSSSVSGSWANAEEMGALAGRNMTGAALKYTGFLSLMNTFDILTTPITTIGMINPPPSGYDVFVEQGDGPYRKLVFKNDVIVGALFIGSAERAGVYPYLIKNRIPLGKLKELAVQGRLGAHDFQDPDKRSLAAIID
jgi:NAD(P)H-nitrite reductase large subunit